MPLRFFADHCVPASVAKSLEDGGHQVARLQDHLPRDSRDAAVLSMAQRLNSILISLDGDFCDIVAYPPAQFRGIIALQVKNHPEVLPTMLRRLHAYFAVYPSMEDYVGRLLLVEAHRIRSRE